MVIRKDEQDVRPLFGRGDGRWCRHDTMTEKKTHCEKQRKKYASRVQSHAHFQCGQEDTERSCARRHLPIRDQSIIVVRLLLVRIGPPDESKNTNPWKYPLPSFLSIVRAQHFQRCEFGHLVVVVQRPHREACVICLLDETFVKLGCGILSIWIPSTCIISILRTSGQETVTPAQPLKLRGRQSACN